MFYARPTTAAAYHTPLNVFPSFVTPLRFRIFCQDNGPKTVLNLAFYVKKLFVARFGALYRPGFMQINRLQAQPLTARLLSDETRADLRQ